jgi:hypothetical protein
MNWTVIGLVVLCCCVTISAALLFRDTDGIDAEARVSVSSPKQVESVETVAPEPMATPEPTTTAPKLNPELVQMNGITILHQRVPLLDLGYSGERYYLVPGAHFPGLQGLRLDDAVRLVMTSFPMLTVRAIMVGDPVAYEFRRDRLTIIYDSFTKRVVSARIG